MSRFLPCTTKFPLIPLLSVASPRSEYSNSINTRTAQDTIPKSSSSCTFPHRQIRCPREGENVRRKPSALPQQDSHLVSCCAGCTYIIHHDNRSRIHHLTPVSYTHLTLPTNRE